MGPSVATAVILESNLKDAFELVHLNTSDHRDLDKIGAIDFRNIYLAFKHYVLLFWMLITRWPDMVYIPVSQTTIGYFRDAGFILTAKMFRRKVLCHLRGGYFKNWLDSSSRLTRFFVKKIHRLVDGQIVLGESLKHLFTDILEEKKIFVVPNGGSFRMASELSDDKKEFRVIYLANFISTKGILDTLKGMLIVQKQCPGIEAVFAGSWHDDVTKNEFYRILENNPGMRVTVKEKVIGEEKTGLLASSDVFVFPTCYPFEGHPWVIVEAMAAGLPIISTDQGAIAEYVIDGENGFIVEKRNPQQIAEKIIEMFEDTAMRRRMGEQNREHYLCNFTEEKMVEKMSRAFNGALKN